MESSRMTRIVVLVGAVVFLSGGITPAASQSSVEFWVDGVSGSDTNAGSQSAPFKTIARANSAVASAASGVPINVFVLEGEYQNDPIISQKDGGGIAPIRYCSESYIA